MIVASKPGPDLDQKIARRLGMRAVPIQINPDTIIGYSLALGRDETGDYIQFDSPSTNLIAAFGLLEWGRKQHLWIYELKGDVSGSEYPIHLIMRVVIHQNPHTQRSVSVRGDNIATVICEVILNAIVKTN